MPLIRKVRRARDAKRDIGKELLQAIRDVKAGHHGARYQVAAYTQIGIRFPNPP